MKQTGVCTVGTLDLILPHGNYRPQAEANQSVPSAQVRSAGRKQLIHGIDKQCLSLCRLSIRYRDGRDGL
ncbi:hypothetical protein M378DRAFT_324231 [Amanita muscaria Koide BX008]|uniref:Uncharacterized protein n=1 Tax=Amanita muscaria (strain Koide BX008) TaxID=946122 RepID=A0A0C2TJ93_AMAMK|nr:hypothetical protein M378DRAFT_324231 [Amanita muscaria Koide BX008]